MARLWHLLLCGLLLAAVADAAPTPNSSINCQSPQTTATAFTANPGTYKTIFTGGVGGGTVFSKIVSIYVTTTDPTTPHAVTIQYSNSTSSHCAGGLASTTCFGGTTVSIPANAGFATGTPPVSMMPATNWPGLPLESDGNTFFPLPSTATTLEATYATPLSGADAVYFVVIGCDF